MKLRYFWRLVKLDKKHLCQSHVPNY